MVNFSGASASLSNGVSGPISTFPYDSICMSATSSGLGAASSPLDATGSSFSVSTTWPGDVNADGRVDINDLTIVLTNYGKTLGVAAAGVAAVPEPVSLLLAAAGALGLLACTWRKRAA
jgi:hypothetical protein